MALWWRRLEATPTDTAITTATAMTAPTMSGVLVLRRWRCSRQRRSSSSSSSAFDDMLLSISAAVSTRRPGGSDGENREASIPEAGLSAPQGAAAEPVDAEAPLEPALRVKPSVPLVVARGHAQAYAQISEGEKKDDPTKGSNNKLLSERSHSE